ncbi:hypothetical protein K439DRAFT_1292644, partial [Ramaria rubella]
YRFTDYCSQGQTIPNIIVDIPTPPTGGRLTLFNLYVSLSQSSGQDTIRLEELNAKTSEWWER